MLSGHEDRALHARLTAVLPLAGVRAGSSLLRHGERLLAVQDDAWSVAWIDLPALAITPLVLHGDGATLRKKLKPDFEAALIHDGCIHLLGSGSRENRRTLARIDLAATSVTLRERHDLYEVVHAALGPVKCPNIEGALTVAGQLRLFHRGAGGAPSAVLDLPDAALDGESARVLGTHWFELGTIEQTALAFTDVALLGDGRIAFSASAERSDDAVADGPVAGSALGLIEQGPLHSTLRWTRVLEADGQPTHRKIEGLALDDDRRGGWLLTDPDDAARPAELCRVALEGFV